MRGFAITNAKSSHQFFGGKSKNACKTGGSRNSDQPQDAEVVAHCPVSADISTRIRFTGEAESAQAPRPLSRACPADETDHCLSIPEALSPEQFDAMAYPHMDEMLWLGGRWWWFPGRQTSAQSQFGWKNGRAYLLEPDGSAVEGILFVGEVATE
jgi:hypothetical protein